MNRLLAQSGLADRPVVHAEGTRWVYAVDACGLGRVAMRCFECSTPEAIGSALRGLR
jgi:hypothetical protein